MSSEAKKRKSDEGNDAEILLSLSNSKHLKANTDHIDDSSGKSPEVVITTSNSVRTNVPSEKKVDNSQDPVILYDENNKAPFYVYADILTDGPVNQMKESACIGKLGYKNIDSVKKISSYKRCKIGFTCFKEANKLAMDEKSEVLGYKTFIPPNFPLKFGLVFGVPIEYSNQELLDMAVQTSMYPIKDVQRIMSKDKETKIDVPTTRVKIGFASAILS